MIFEEKLRKSACFAELLRLFEAENAEILENELIFKAFEVLKFAYEILSTKTDCFERISQELVGNIVKIVEITIEKIAGMDERFKNFDNFVQKNAFSLIFLVVKDFDEGILTVFLANLLKTLLILKKIWDFLMRILKINENYFYSYLTMIMMRDLTLLHKDKLLNLRNKSLILSVVVINLY